MRSGFRLIASWFVVMSAAAAITLTGCTQVKKTPPSAAKSSEPYRVEKEGKIPPLAPSDVRKEVDREEAYEDLPVTEEAVSVENVEPVNEPPPAPNRPSPPADSTRVQAASKTVQGYRVQLFASASEDAARSVKEAAEVRLGGPAYIERIDGIYKVRVGDCPTREDAETLLAKCREAGYGDAWIATGTILLPSGKARP
jgi:cell division septation protein DedD